MKHGQIAEYAEISKDQLSKVNTLETAVNGTREFRLTHHSRGWECAGSMARWNDLEMYGVLFEMAGATNGRKFLKQDEAKALFDKWAKA